MLSFQCMYTKIVRLLRSPHEKKGQKPQQYTTDVQQNLNTYPSLSINRLPFSSLITYRSPVAIFHRQLPYTQVRVDLAVVQNTPPTLSFRILSRGARSAIRCMAMRFAGRSIELHVHSFTCVIRPTTIVCDRQVMQAFRIYCICMYYFY